MAQIHDTKVEWIEPDVVEYTVGPNGFCHMAYDRRVDHIELLEGGHDINPHRIYLHAGARLQIRAVNPLANRGGTGE
jgi:hypothetical protein